MVVDALSPTLASWLEALPADHRCHAFEKAWARHEASLKCLGLPLDEWLRLPKSVFDRLELVSTRTEAPFVIACAWHAQGVASA